MALGDSFFSNSRAGASPMGRAVAYVPPVDPDAEPVSVLDAQQGLIALMAKADADQRAALARNNQVALPGVSHDAIRLMAGDGRTMFSPR